MKNIFDNNISFIDYARSGIIYYTENLEEIEELTKNGWKFYSCNKGFRLTPPEECIVDITNYEKAMQYQNLEINLIYYQFLKKLLACNKLNKYIDTILQKKEFFYKGFKYLISSGPILETEIRIFGNDNRIKNLKIDMIKSFLNINQNNLKAKSIKLKPLIAYKIPLENRTIKEKLFFKDLRQKISLIKNTNIYNEMFYKIYNIDLIKQNNFDIYLFIPFGCFKYLSSFINEDNVKKIMFWEIHAEKTNISTFKLFSKDMKNKKVLIIDNIYSGKTIQKIKNKVLKNGGKPYILGLNPKNKNNIFESDYSMILNHIFKREELNIEESNFFINKYKKILKE